jgi:tetratricopeptide (TPR) repeat protein
LFPDNTFLPQARSKVAFEHWSKIEQLPLTLKTDPTQLKKVEEHYEFSIASMVRAANAQGVPVILLTVPTNLRDWQPNVSLVSVQGEQERLWKGQYHAGRSALLKGDAAVAATAFAAASALDPGHAASHYYRGRALEAEGKFTEAYEAYDLSRNLDANPFRAISSFNAIIRRTARESKNARLVDADQLFRQASSPRAPGFDLLLDYVHPTTRGNKIIAKGVFEAIVGGRYIGPQPSSGFPDLTTYDETKDQSLQRTLVVLAMMMHQYETVIDKVKLIASNPGGFESLGKVESARIQTIYDVFRSVLELERRELLFGDVRTEEKDSLRTRLNQVYQDLFGNYQEFQRQVAQ